MSDTKKLTLLTSQERDDLTIHVDADEVRYNQINSRFDKIESDLGELSKKISGNHLQTLAGLIGTIATILGSLVALLHHQ